MYKIQELVSTVGAISSQAFYAIVLKGGDPAAPSGTATLLRLHPSHQPHLRRLSPCG